MDGVVLTKLNQFKDEKGMVMHFLKKSDPHFSDFGEVYFSMVHQGIIKGWKLHTRIIQNLVVPFGSVKFTLLDLRRNSLTLNDKKEVTIGVENYHLLRIPAGICYNFEGLGDSHSLVSNYISEEYDASEAVNYPLETTDFPVF